MGLGDVLYQIDPYIAYVTPFLKDFSGYLGIDINILIFIGLSFLLLLLYVLYAAFTPVAKRRGRRVRRGEVQRRPVSPEGLSSTPAMGVRDLPRYFEVPSDKVRIEERGDKILIDLRDLEEETSLEEEDMSKEELGPELAEEKEEKASG